jgi:hypothetical protein
MQLSEKDIELIRKLAKEGKQISKIRDEDFHEFDYWDIYWAVYEDGGQSARGAKWKIANRLKKLSEANKDERERLINELDELIWSLYNNYKDNQKKLDQIRKALD